MLGVHWLYFLDFSHENDDAPNQASWGLKSLCYKLDIGEELRKYFKQR